MSAIPKPSARRRSTCTTDISPDLAHLHKQRTALRVNERDDVIVPLIDIRLNA